MPPSRRGAYASSKFLNVTPRRSPIAGGPSRTNDNKRKRRKKYPPPVSQHLLLSVSAVANAVFHASHAVLNAITSHPPTNGNESPSIYARDAKTLANPTNGVQFFPRPPNVQANAGVKNNINTKISRNCRKYYGRRLPWQLRRDLRVHLPSLFIRMFRSLALIIG